MADTLDFVKLHRNLYGSGTKPAVVRVPAMRFIMVDGTGAPEGEAYQNAVGVLYGLSFTIKMSKMGSEQLPGYVDYKMPPLEGLWDGLLDAAGHQVADGPLQEADLQKSRDQWRWTSMIRQPDFVTKAVFGWALERARIKSPELDFSPAHLAEFEEGLCVQALHKGPFSTEPATLNAMLTFARENGYAEDYGSGRRHHEIYLKNPRRTKPENMQTILRLPVREGF